MLFEVTRCCAGELTLQASERLLTGMCSHVVREAAFCCADVFALVAAERLFSSMTKHMDFQIIRASGCVSTHVATMGFLPPSVLNSLGRRRHRTKLASPPWGEGLLFV